MTSFVFLVTFVLVMLLPDFRRAGLGRIAAGAINDFVEAAMIDPHTPALRTVVNLDALASAIINWRLHAGQFMPFRSAIGHRAGFPQESSTLKGKIEE